MYIVTIITTMIRNDSAKVATALAGLSIDLLILGTRRGLGSNLGIDRQTDRPRFVLRASRPSGGIPNGVPDIKLEI